MVWIVPDGNAQSLRFHAISDSAIVSGLIFLALRVYSGRSAQEILDTEPSYIQDIGLARHLAHPQQWCGGDAGLHPRDGAGAAAARPVVSEPATAEDSALGLLSRPGFARLLAYRIFAMLSYQVVAVTVGWHIYEVTRNPFSLGLIGLAEVVPFFCVAPFAGYLVDHLPRRRLGMVACCGLIATALVLTSVAMGWLPIDGVWPIYAAIALTGMVRAFLSPIYNALFARVLARDQFARGAGLGAVVFQAGMIAGPALGGVLVGFGGKGLSYAVATAFALVAMACLATLKVEEPVHTGPAAPIFRASPKARASWSATGSWSARWRWTCSRCCWAAW